MLKEVMRIRTSMVYEFELTANITEEEGAICGGTAMLFFDANPGADKDVFIDMEHSIMKGKQGILATFIHKQDEIINKRLFKDIHNPYEMDRRDFTKKMGGGLIIAFSVSDLPFLTGYKTGLSEQGAMNAYLRIGEDGRVTFYTGKIEMGQGPITSLPMNLADELDVNLNTVDIVMGDTDLCPWDEGTYGSLSTRVFGQTLRATAAETRVILLEMASRELSVSTDQLMESEGIVTLKNDKTKHISYAKLTQGKKILENIKKEPSMKNASEFKVMGKSRLHFDGFEKVTGKAKNSGDIQLP